MAIGPTQISVGTPFQVHKCKIIAGSTGCGVTSIPSRLKPRHTRHRTLKAHTRRRSDYWRCSKRTRFDGIRCLASKDDSQGGLGNFLKWSKAVLRKFTAEVQSQAQASSQPQSQSQSGLQKNSLSQAKSEQENSRSRDEKLEDSSELANPPQTLAHSPEDELVKETIELEEDDRPSSKLKAKFEKEVGQTVHFSTISRYKPEPGDVGEKKTRSSIGRDSVRINAREGAFSRLSNTNAQKNYFEKVISTAAKKEQAEKELKLRKKKYHHLSRRREITHDWPKEDELEWEDWKDMIKASDEEALDIGWKKHQLKQHLKAGDFKTAADLKAQIDEEQKKDNMTSILKAYKAAVDAQDYEKAAHLRDSGGLGLVGWWWPSSGTREEVVPHLLRVSPAHNRLVMNAFSCTDLGHINGTFERKEFQSPTSFFGSAGVSPGEDGAIMTEQEGEDDFPQMPQISSEETSEEAFSTKSEKKSGPPGLFPSSLVAEVHLMTSPDSACSFEPKEMKSQATAVSMTIIPGSTASLQDQSIQDQSLQDQSQEGSRHAQTTARIETDEEGRATLVMDVQFEGDSGSDDESGSENETDLDDVIEVLADGFTPDQLKSMQISNGSGLLVAEPTDSDESDDSGDEKTQSPGNSPEFDSGEIAKRKDDMLKSINLHHHLDDSKEVPILHLFLTAKKDEVKAYKQVQKAEPAEKPSKSVVKRFKDMQKHEDYLAAMRDQIGNNTERSSQNNEDPPEAGLNLENLDDSQIEAVKKTIREMPGFSIRTERVPADITRFEGDNDRFLLSIFPSPQEQAAAEEALKEQQNKPSPSTSEKSESSPETGQSVLLQTQEDVQNLVRQFVKDNGMDPREITIDLMKTLEETGVLSADLSPETPQREGREGEPEELYLNTTQFFELSGQIQYKRLPRDISTADPFSGVFLKCHWYDGHLVSANALHLERKKHGKLEYVIARDITSDLRQNGKPCFRAVLGRNQKLDFRWYFHPYLQVTARYKAQQWTQSEDGGRWTDGAELVEFSETDGDGQKTAKLGFVPDAGYGEASMTLNMLHKLELDDPFTDASTPYSDFLDNLMDR